MTISKDRVRPSPLPDSWKLKEIFATGVVFGSYLALMTVIFFWAMNNTNFFSVRITVLFSCNTCKAKEKFFRLILFALRLIFIQHILMFS